MALPKIVTAQTVNLQISEKKSDNCPITFITLLNSLGGGMLLLRDFLLSFLSSTHQLLLLHTGLKWARSGS